MRQVYLDNGATSYPKPPQVAQAMLEYVTNVGGNVSRGGYARAYTAGEILYETRERLCAIFGFAHPRNVIFTANVTYALNFILKGCLNPGDHVLVSSLEHNAVMRPLVQLEEQGILFSRIPCRQDGAVDLDAAQALIRPNTRMAVMTHASNVSGMLLPVEEMGALCRQNDILFAVDTAQTAGAIPIDMAKMQIDGLAFTGHKGLMGPQGIGGFLATDRLAEQMRPLIAGGTGSYSHLESIPPLLPDRFEAGTPNLPGIYGLHAALEWVQQTGTEQIGAHEATLVKLFESGLQGCDAIRIVGPFAPAKKTGVVSVDFAGRDNAEIARRLEQEYGIMTRCGLHCAPFAHQTLGTYPQGTVRFSFGWYNTEEEARYAADAVLSICS